MKKKKYTTTITLSDEGDSAKGVSDALKNKLVAAGFIRRENGEVTEFSLRTKLDPPEVPATWSTDGRNNHRVRPLRS